MENINIPELVCKKCGATWIPRVANPKKCPVCQTRDWKKEEKKDD